MRATTRPGGQGDAAPGLSAPGIEPARLLDAVLDALPSGVAMLDTAGRIIRVNHSAERTFGHVEADLVGRPATDLFPGHLRHEVADALGTVLAGDRFDSLETEVQRHDGTPSPISLTVWPVRDEGGAVVAAVLVAADITEQRLAQATLAEIDERVREAEALAHLGTWLWDLRTDTVQWTDEVHRIHGIDPLQFEGTLAAHLACVHDADRDRVAVKLSDAVGAARTFLDEYRVVRPNGELRWVASRAEPTIGSAGTVVGLRGVIQDVTDRRNPAATS